MTTIIDVTQIDDPTVIDISTPHCTACRAMRPDLEVVAQMFAGRVARVRLDAAADFEAVRSLGVMGTPALIGVRGGSVVLRATGRRSRQELEELFGAVEAGKSTAGIGRADAAVRIGGGAALAVAGVFAGPAWPLVAIGAGIAVIGLAGTVRR